MQYIECKDLKLHNLKSISVNVPKGQLTVITGVSGSGKSTFAFDILAAAGQARYLSAIGAGGEAMNVYNITGLSPAVSVSQNLKRQSNPRSTVGSRTGILPLLQSLFVEIGKGNNSGLRLEPNMFSQYSAMGMCYYCYGRGVVSSIDEQTVFRSFINSDKPVIDVLNRNLRMAYKQYCQRMESDHTLPFSKLTAKLKEAVLYGDSEIYFKGMIPYYRECAAQDFTNNMQFCEKCNGTGLREESLAIKIDGKNISEFKQLNIQDLFDIFLKLRENHNEYRIASYLLSGLIVKCDNLINSNLDYVTIDRKVPTLSGGEFQRLLLSTFFDLGLNDLIYVFDEPTMGLHESEKRHLIQKIKQLKTKGNTVIVVEHDLGALEEADYIIELGKGGGTEGGNITFQGSYDDFIKSETSVIRQAMAKMATSPDVLISGNEDNEYLSLEHITVNNLKDVSVSIPLHKLVGVAGVSGSGKSSLISQGLVPMLNIAYDEDENDENEYKGKNSISEAIIKNNEKIKRALYVIQKPIGRNKKSMVATYIQIWDFIRQIYLKEAQKIGLEYKIGHFSYNSEGACEKCGGEGEIVIAGASHICDRCEGTKFKKEILEITYNGLNINEIQKITVAEALSLFQDDKIRKVLETLNDLCLGYLTLGQSTKTISGGEAQRIKLAVELCTQNAVDFLYVLDEPTAGLSCHDILALSDILKRLVAKGNTVIVIEHDLQMLTLCDHIIEMGPKSGVNGGRIIAEGSIGSIIANENSIIAPYFQQFLNSLEGNK